MFISILKVTNRSTKNFYCTNFGRVLCKLILGFLATFVLASHAAVASVFVAPPSMYVSGGFAASSRTVTLQTPQPNPAQGSYIVYYTTDGTDPQTSSSRTAYGPLPFVVSTSNTQVRAITFASSAGYSTEISQYIEIPIFWVRADQGVVTNPGSPGPQITAWDDFSTSAYNAVGSSSSYPTVNSNAINYSPAVVLNGSSSYFSLPASIFDTFGSGLSIFIVAKPSTTNTGFLFDVGNGNLSDNVTVSTTGTTCKITADNGTTSSNLTSSSGAITVGQFQLIEAFQDGAGNGSLYVNGQLAAAGSLNNLNNIPRSNNHIGTNYNAGANFFQGSIAEVLVYPNNLPAVSRHDIEAWIIQRYQLLSQTPSTPIISVGAGSTTTLGQPTQVSIATPPGATTYYTLSPSPGTTPTTSSPIYNGAPITINYSQTLEAMSVKNGVPSAVATATYVLDSNLWPALNPSDMSAPSVTNLQLPTATVP